MSGTAPVPHKHAPPAAVRNTDPILAVLTRVFSSQLTDGDTVVEVAAGSGYHAAAFARAMPRFMWQPTDPSAEARQSIAVYAAEENLDNLLPPLDLDASAVTWPMTEANAITCINMIHISPWEATLGLLAGAARYLPGGGPLVMYGPYSVDGDFIADSNVAFDQSLKARNATWGIRDVRDVAAAASERGFHHEETISMPANNITLVFRKTG